MQNNKKPPHIAAVFSMMYAMTSTFQYGFQNLTNACLIVMIKAKAA